jgi:ABC-type nitrate/sulfonate/bicarbonate transport system permease component
MSDHPQAAHAAVQHVHPRRKRPSLRASRGIWLRALSIVFGLVAWEILARWVFPNIFIPSLSQVMERGYELVLNREVFLHIWASIKRILLGFLIGSSIGAPIGLLMGSIPSVRFIIDPYIQFFRFIPSIAWLTPAVIWFGIGEMSKVMIIIYTTVFIVVINTAVGVASVPPNKIWAARMLGASKLQVFSLVTIPATMPYILTGMMLAMGSSFTAVVAAEMVGAEEGLGYLIFNSRLWMDTRAIFLAIIVLGFLGFAFDMLFRHLIRRFAGRYGAVG